MSRPGDRLRALAARVCSADAMRLIDPVLADMQAEHAEAIRRGRVWRSRWVRLAGYIAFAKVFVIGEWSAAGDMGSLFRTVVYSFGAIALVTAAFVAIPYYAQRGYTGPDQDRWQSVIFLLPQALGVSIPTGATIGLATGMERQQLSVRLTTLVAALALLWSVGSAVNLGWVVPTANQAFRAAMFRRMSETPPPKGDTELTFPELARKIAQQGRFPVERLHDHGLTLLQVGYYMRWALAFATLALALFMMSLLALSRRPWVIGIGTVGAIFGYYALQYVGRSFALGQSLSPPVAAWLANGVFAMVSVVLMAFCGLRQRDRRTPGGVVSGQGSRLRAAAAAVFDPVTMERVVDPAIADLQVERRPVAGYLAVIKVIIVCLAGGPMRMLQSWSDDERSAIYRAIGVSLVALPLLTALVAWAPFRIARVGGTAGPVRLALALLPFSMGISVPAGLAFGIALGLGGSAVSNRLARAVALAALVVECASVVNTGWIAPALNPILQVTTSEVDLRMREMTDASRWSMTLAPLALALFTLSVVRWPSMRRWFAGVSALIAVVGYLGMGNLGRSLILDGQVPAFVGALLPNGVFLTLAAALSACRPSAGAALAQRAGAEG